eukprot:Hpha_TRINITY_DN13750_c0_g2::TRINITY_DN13750_c0_g2_i1::g.142662::m.142662
MFRGGLGVRFHRQGGIDLSRHGGGSRDVLLRLLILDPAPTGNSQLQALEDCGEEPRLPLPQTGREIHEKEHRVELRALSPSTTHCGGSSLRMVGMLVVFVCVCCFLMRSIKYRN